MTDVTDATFQTDVIERSATVPVVIDLWAPWCGPCKTLGPIIEEVIAATDGAVELAKVNVDENPRIAQSFQVQSIPAVFAIRDGQVVDAFVGAQPRPVVEAFVAKLAPAPSEADLLSAKGDEASLRAALDIERDHPGAVIGLSRLLIGNGDAEGALELLARIPETAEARAVAAEARLAQKGVAAGADVEALLDSLLDRVKADEAARQEFVDLLETLGPEDPRTGRYRRALASRLY